MICPVPPFLLLPSCPFFLFSSFFLSFPPLSLPLFVPPPTLPPFLLLLKDKLRHLKNAKSLFVQKSIWIGQPQAGNEQQLRERL